MFDVIEPVGDDYPVEPEPARKRGKPTARGAAIVGVRVAAGAVGIAVAAAAILAAAIVPLPTVRQGLEPVAVTPVPTAQQLVCPGALLRLGDASGQAATTATTLGRSTVRFDSTSGEVATAPVAPADAAANAAGTTPLQLSLPVGDSGEEPLLAGAQAQSIRTGDFAGLAAASCGAVATETWLVGGSTAVGRTTLVTLANPSDTVSTVNLAISGENGAVAAPGAAGIVVQPHSQREIPLAGFAPGLASPVVHVVSRGGQIVAGLQQATVRGLETGGVDIVGSTKGPATTQVIPGVVVAQSDPLRTRLGEEGYGDLESALRVFVPGDQVAKVEVSLVADGGSAESVLFSVDLEPGAVRDIPMEEIADGSYSVHLDSDVPVVAGLRVSTIAAGVDAAGAATAGRSDFAWLSAARALLERALVTIAPGPRPRVHLDNPTTATTEVTLEALDGNDVTVSVPAGGSASVDVIGETTYRLDGFEYLYGSVSYVGEGELAGYPIQPPLAAADAVTIYP